MTAHKFTIWRFYRRWSSRIYALAAKICGGRTVLSAPLIREAAAYRANPERPVILLALHTRGLNTLLSILRYWPRKVVIFATTDSIKLMTFLQSLRLLSHKLEFTQTLTPKHLREIKACDAALLAMCDVHISQTDQYHYIINGRIRRFNATWAVVAQRLAARTICLKPKLAGLNCTVEHIELLNSRSPYNLATAALDYFFDTPEAIKAWDFLHIGELEQLADGSPQSDDVEALYAAYAPHSLFDIELPSFIRDDSARGV